MATLLGLTFGLPAVTFQAIPAALPVARLSIPSPPSGSHLPQSRRYTGIYHFGHTADPIYMGACNGFNSVCSWAGYAFESYCHAGQTCTYDTVKDKGWRMGIGTHRIKAVLRDVPEAYEDVPGCVAPEPCDDCALWKFVDGSEPVTTISTSGTATVATTTTTTTTTRAISTSLDSTSAIITSTCKTPG